MKIETVGLLGFGRFGQMAYRYLRRDKRLRVHDCNTEKTRGLAEAATFEEALSSQLIVLCVPISEVKAACQKMAPLVRPGQIVVDTCSVKRRPIEWMTGLLPESVQIVGTHPLFGPDSGHDGIAGLKIALCAARVDPDTYAVIRRYLARLQLVTIEPTPEEHDRQMARGQAIFHLIAQTMKRLDWTGQAISTPGPETFYRLVRTVQHDTDQLFRDMARENPFADQYRQEFIDEMQRLERELTEASLARER